ncbi:MAG: S46 family peptidase [Bacteroidota bacterium]|nr:S46 family peptidase [Bacteroidota bacterium]
MKKITMLIVAILISAFVFNTKADEGMWIPLLIEKMNIQQMQENGFKLSAEDIYSVNQASMKDAVMIFGGGCTGELISDKGLLITNHHCGYRRIQQHSTVEHDYLTNGFWAMSMEEELPNPGLTVTFLKWMKDVSEQVSEGVADNMTEKDREEVIEKNIYKLIEEAIEGTHYTAHIEDFFRGNQYYLFVEEKYKDVRLVGAPPSSIGKFGGDTDNWMWPRHTGDFSLFRIYADKDNKPAEYSKDNQAFIPAKSFPISLKGTSPNDFTFIFGYPGSTYEYVPSYHLTMLTEKIYPKLISVRDKKLEIMSNDMEENPGVRIQYSAKSASVSNSWKRWIGEINGLEKLDAISKKQSFEADFQAWSDSDHGRKQEYGSLLSDYKKLYEDYSKYRLAKDYISEVFIRTGAELVAFSGRFEELITKVENNAPENEIRELADNLESQTGSFFKDYNEPTDYKLFIALLKMFGDNIGPEFQPSIFINIHSKYHNDYEKYARAVYKKTIFSNPQKLLEILESPGKASIKKIANDPILNIYRSVIDLYAQKVLPEYERLTRDMNKLNRIYMAAQMEFQEDKIFYPDANFTLRLSYGKVKGYAPRDGVFYKHYTTLDGIMEKDNPEIYDYDVPQKLKELYTTKDYGRFAQGEEMHVCFIATNHTTGGNSGSPVLNAEGHLIGINFDRAWEGVMSDLMFNPDQCRNISLDIRYALFIIDKFAGAGYLLEEMTIVE